MNDHDLELAARVAERRRAKGWSQADLVRHARAAGLDRFHQTTISRIESGTGPVTFGEAITLARLLDLDLSDPDTAADQFQAGYLAALQTVGVLIDAEVDRISAQPAETPTKDTK